MKKENRKIGKKIVFILSVEPYSQDCIVVVNGQFSDALNEIKKHKTANSLLVQKHVSENAELYKDDYEMDGGGRLYTKLPKGYIMLISHCGDLVDTVGLVTHECLHLTHYVLTNAGITLTKESEEAYTYLCEKLVESILQKIY